MKLTIPALLLTLVTAPLARAEGPKVVSDILPVHVLVQQVMDGVDHPQLLLEPGASAHNYSLRPSQARALSDADLIFWIGPELTPWLAKPISNLASSALEVELLSVQGTLTLPFREDVAFSDTTKEGHSDHEDEDGHSDEHSHDGIDPHAWLYSQNALIWVEAIANELSKTDPAHAEVYQQNATNIAQEIRTVEKEIAKSLATISSTPFLVYHDAYQYFENQFKLAAAGAISVSDASKPGPARITALQSMVHDHNISCVLAEPLFNPALVTTIFGKNPVRTVQTDPLGASLDPNTATYADLLRYIANGFTDCLSG